MQFSYNSDYPGLTAATASSPSTYNQTENIPRDPPQFPPAEPIPCAKITTRVFHPTRNQVSIVRDVLIRTMNCPVGLGSLGNNNNNIKCDGGLAGGNMSSDSSSSQSSSDDDSMALDDDSVDSSSWSPHIQNDANEIKHAYWIQRTIREAIYGRVLFAVILKRRPRSLVLSDGAEWEVTRDHCAVKEMSLEHIRREKDRLAEDPIKEVASMQYLNRWCRYSQQCSIQQHQLHQLHHDHMVIPPLQQADNNSHADVTQSFFAMRDTNIMMPLDLLLDERNLYSIMPYCDGGELFERLDLNERFSEDEARYWMHQVLNVSPI